MTDLLKDSELVKLNHFIIDCNSQGISVSFPEGLERGMKSTTLLKQEGRASVRTSLMRAMTTNRLKEVL